MSEYKKFDSIRIPNKINKSAINIKCNICGDSGVVFDSNGNMKPCICWKKNQLSIKQKKAGLPIDLQNMTFNTFDLSYYPANEKPEFSHNNQYSYLDFAKNAKAKAELFVRQITDYNTANIKGIMFQGQVGSGKTHLAAAIANCLIKKNINVVFSVVPDFLDEMRMCYGNYGEFNEVSIMNRAKNAEVLVLDDLGTHNFSEWTKNKLFSLINYRLNNRLPMIITTNLNLDELKEIVGERVISRIIAGCIPCFLPVKRDIRLTKINR